MILRIMGWLLLIEAFFMLFPMLASILCDESDWKVFLFSSGVTAITGVKH